MSYNDSSYLRNSSGVIINTNADRQITEARQKKDQEKSILDALSSVQKNQNDLMEQIKELKASFDILLEKM